MRNIRWVSILVAGVLHGALVGAAAVLIYEILAFGQPVPRTWPYFLAHALKIGGGAAGGWIAARRARASVPRAHPCDDTRDNRLIATAPA